MMMQQAPQPVPDSHPSLSHQGGSYWPEDDMIALLQFGIEIQQEIDWISTSLSD
jgi:hypothetical protein